MRSQPKDGHSRTERSVCWALMERFLRETSVSLYHVTHEHSVVADKSQTCLKSGFKQVLSKIKVIEFGHYTYKLLHLKHLKQNTKQV